MGGGKMPCKFSQTSKSIRTITKQETFPPNLQQDYQPTYISQQFQSDKFIRLPCKNLVFRTTLSMNFIGGSFILTSRITTLGF